MDEKHFRKYVCENPSDLGLEVAQFLDDLIGFHRIEPDLREKVDWTNDHHIIIPFPSHFQLHTWDYDLLTRLVVFSHDRMMRVEVNPRHYRWLELVFHKRHTREGQLWERMPTLEDHVEMIRGRDD
jgi:hypothetical protein